MDSVLSDHQTCSTSNKSPVELEDHHRSMVKLEYIHNLAIKEEMSYRSQHYCDYCIYGSKSIFFMLNHVRRHRFPSQLFDCTTSNVELYHCKNCGINYNSIIHLRNHINGKHSGNEKIEDHAVKSYFCETCSFTTGSALESLKHVRTGCLKMNLSSINTLQMVKKERKWFHCEKCTFQASVKSNLVKHIIKEHMDDKNKRLFQCKTRRNGLILILISKHNINGNEKPSFHCKKCTYKTTFKDKFKQHMAMHPNDKGGKWFQCNKCPFKTRRKEALKRHIVAKHTDDNEKPWLHCEKCTFKTIQKSNLNKHILSKHTDDQSKKRFPCEKCTYRAVTNYILKMHIMAKHTDDKDKQWFHCEKCNYKALKKYRLQRHILSKHTDDKDKM